MAVHSLFPGFIKIHYTANAHTHVQVLPVKPYYAPLSSQWFLQTKSDSVGNYWQTLMATYIGVLKVFLKTTDSIDFADLFNIPSEGADPVFADTMVIATAGTASGTATSASQLEIGFRTSLGGHYRWMNMENAVAYSANQKVFPPYTGFTPIINLVAYLTGSGSIVFGRDGGSLSASIKMLTKVNDALRKKYLVNT